MAKGRYLQSRNVIFVSLVLILATVQSEENIALSRTASQSRNKFPDKWLASAAVDGCQQTDIDSGCCAHTQDGYTTIAWWRVDLGQISTINSIQVVYRDYHQHRLAGYQLYVSNYTYSSPRGIRCYEDTSETESDVQLNVTHQCPYVGRYVIVYINRNWRQYGWYSEHAILELCEVFVYGCPSGSYGDGDCNKVCPSSCYGGNCNSKTGSCLYCARGLYGDFCENTCSADCKSRLCNKDTGFCQDCIPGKFGDICERTCSNNCNSIGCIKDTGHCYECNDGYHGDFCDMDCPVNCRDRMCDVSTGHCTECTDGKFGDTCELDCSVNCKDRLCVKDTGSCTECVPYKYGLICKQDCPSNCQNGLCDRNNADCIECVAGTYGRQCTQACSIHCKDRVCTKTTGHCIDCTLGKYGDNCVQECPVNCQKECSRINAICVGCKTGRYGATCTSICPVTCKDFVCGQQTGQCLDTSNTNQPHATSSTNQPPGTSSTNQPQVDSKDIIIIAVAAVGGLLAVALITTIICMCRNRNHGKSSSNKTTDQSKPDTGYSSIDRARGDVGQTNVYEMVVT